MRPYINTHKNINKRIGSINTLKSIKKHQITIKHPQKHCNKWSHILEATVQSKYSCIYVWWDSQLFSSCVFGLPHFWHCQEVDMGWTKKTGGNTCGKWTSHEVTSNPQTKQSSLKGQLYLTPLAPSIHPPKHLEAIRPWHEKQASHWSVIWLN